MATGYAVVGQRIVLQHIPTLLDVLASIYMSTTEPYLHIIMIQASKSVTLCMYDIYTL